MTPKVAVDLVQLVRIPTTDQDRSVRFYESLGFEKRVDAPWGEEHRWIELYPPGTSTGLALVPADEDAPSGADTGVILNTADIDAFHTRCRDLGFDVDDHVARVGGTATIRLGPVTTSDPVPPMFWLQDPDGNRLLVVEPG